MGVAMSRSEPPPPVVLVRVYAPLGPFTSADACSGLRERPSPDATPRGTYASVSCDALPERLT